MAPRLPLAALPLIAVHAALLAVYDLARAPYLTILLLLLAFAAYAWAAHRSEPALTAAGVLTVAAVLRLLLLPLPPALSDDVLRYAWDGKVALAGFNPYLLPPEAAELAALRDEPWQRMPHREVPTVYPPLALAVFGVAALLPQPLVSVKILLCFAELVGCALLIALARRLGLPAGRAAWYCWNPLAAMEVAGMGHVDGLMVTFAIATVLLLVGGEGRRWRGAALAAAAGVLAKLAPAAAVPMWARQSGRPLACAALAVAVAGAGLAPVAIAAGGVPPGLATYGVSWEFNGPLFEPLASLLDRARADAAVKAGLDQLKRLTGLHAPLNRVYPFVYPELLAKGLLALGAGALVWRSLGERHPVLGSGRLFGGLLLCSATVYPWYLLWVLPWAALARHRAWLALTALVQLAYLPKLLGVPHLPWVFLAVWVPFFLILSRTRWSTA